jgi:hypothetical protein
MAGCDDLQIVGKAMAFTPHTRRTLKGATFLQIDLTIHGDRWSLSDAEARSRVRRQEWGRRQQLGWVDRHLVDGIV